MFSTSSLENEKKNCAFGWLMVWFHRFKASKSNRLLQHKQYNSINIQQYSSIPIQYNSNKLSISRFCFVFYKKVVYGKLVGMVETYNFAENSKTLYLKLFELYAVFDFSRRSSYNTTGSFCWDSFRNACWETFRNSCKYFCRTISGISKGTSLEMNSEIPAGICLVIPPKITQCICSGIYLGILLGILSGIPPEISATKPPGNSTRILLGISTGIFQKFLWDFLQEFSRRFL